MTVSDIDEHYHCDTIKLCIITFCCVIAFDVHVHIDTPFFFLSLFVILFFHLSCILQNRLQLVSFLCLSGQIERRT